MCRQRVEETDGALNAVPEDLRGWQQAEQQAAELMAQGWPLSPEQATERPPWFLYGELPGPVWIGCCLVAFNAAKLWHQACLP